MVIWRGLSYRLEARQFLARDIPSKARYYLQRIGMQGLSCLFAGLNQRWRNGTPKLWMPELRDRKLKEPYFVIMFNYMGEEAVAIDRLYLSGEGEWGYDVGIYRVDCGEIDASNVVGFTDLMLLRRSYFSVSIYARRWYNVTRVCLRGRYLSSGNCWSRSDRLRRKLLS